MDKLHEYQEKAVDFCLTKRTVFLAMDMGLGKTAVALETIRRSKQPAIVWAPLRPIYMTWPDETKKWTPELTYDILHGPNKDEIFRNSNADILLINYDGIKWFSKAVLRKDIKWKKRNLVIDESSFIKSHSTMRFKLLKKMFPLWGDIRLDLSATPSPNGYHELWSQYFMLDKGERLMKSFHQFRGMYFNYSGPPVYKTTIREGSYEAIRDRIRPVTYRLKDTDYIKMPETIINDIYIDLPPKLRRQYDQLEKDFYLEFEEVEATAFSAAALGNKLRQFVQGALYTDDGGGAFYPVHKLKIDALKEVVEASAGQPILCPIQFKFERVMINEFLSPKKEIPCIAGLTSLKQGNYYIEEWNKGNIPLLLCHPASVGHGTNLQSVGHIILWYGIPWSLEQYIQLNGRLARQGQKHDTVILNRLLMRDTKDQDVAKVLARKDATQARLLNALRR